MASTVDLVQRAFTGMEMRGEKLHFNPRLPEEIRQLKFRLRYRGQSLAVTVTRDRLTVACLECAERPIQVCYREEECTLEGGRMWEFALADEKAVGGEE